MKSTIKTTLLEKLEALLDEYTATHEPSAYNATRDPADEDWEDHAIAGQLAACSSVFRNLRKGEGSCVCRTWTPFDAAFATGATVSISHRPCAWLDVDASKLRPVALPLEWAALKSALRELAACAATVGNASRSPAMRAIAMMLKAVQDVADTYDRQRPDGYVLWTRHQIDRHTGTVFVVTAIEPSPLESVEEKTAVIEHMRAHAEAQQTGRKGEWS